VLTANIITSPINTRYGRFYVIGTDSVISGSLRMYGEWANHEIELLSHFIQPGYTVVDAGAFIGTHARAFSSFVGDLGKVFAFEARRATASVLIENAKLAYDQNICVINSALGEEASSVVVPSLSFDTNGNFGASTLDALTDQHSLGESVIITSLDSYNFERIDFLKIDVEGMELAVLKGGEKIIGKCRPVIFAECNSLECGVPLIKWSRDNNYLAYGVLSPAYNATNFTGCTENIFGVAQEIGLLLIPLEVYSKHEGILFEQHLPRIQTSDDLVLLLLHKPQYPYEVLAHSPALANLSLEYTSPYSDKLNQVVAERDGQIAGLLKAADERDEFIAHQNQVVAERDGQIAGLLKAADERDEFIAHQNQVVAERDGQIAGLLKAADERDEFIAHQNQALADNQCSLELLQQKIIDERSSIIDEFYQSWSWRISSPVRLISSLAKLYAKSFSGVNIFGTKKLRGTKLWKAVQLILVGRYKELLIKIIAQVKQRRTQRTKHNSSCGNWDFLWSDARYNHTPNMLGYPVDILIPVYNGFDYLHPLLESIKQNTKNGTYRVILIDDCSTDERVWSKLESYSNSFKHFVLLKNEVNLGFVGSVNRAVEHVNSDIFVLLNTDTEVPLGWLERLIAPIQNDPSIASATPFSNCATICSFPNFIQDNELYLGLDASKIDQAFNALPDALSEIQIPTGVGFCMSINLNAVKKSGMFDNAYGRGYGEENDWCMRTAADGYRHILVQNLFVYHKHGGSFASAEKAALIKKNHQVLLARYPEYDQLVASHIQLDPAKTIRQLVKLKLLSAAAESGAVLYIDHALGGGANHYRQAKAKEYKEKKVPVLTLIDDERTNTIKVNVLLNDEEFDIDLPELSRIDTLFIQVKIGTVIYNNAVASSKPLDIIATIANLQKKHRFKLVTLFHDFYPICPSYTLLNKTGVYCGIPSDINICKDCVSKIPSRYSAFIPQDVNMSEWRNAWGNFINKSSKVICFSENSYLIVLKAYPQARNKLVVEPHGISDSGFRKPAIKYDSPLHIGIVGGINYAKGLDVVLGLVSELKKRNNRSIRVTVIGEVDAVTPIEGLSVTGRYKKESLPDYIEQFGINLFLFPSVCPETFSYVTSELIAMDVPLACFDLGAPSDRVRNYSNGKILPLVTNSADLLDSLLAFYESRTGSSL
jgi:FkbM family methyltransferase